MSRAVTRPTSGSSTRDATLRVSATTVKDAQGPLSKAAVRLYLDGGRIPRFSYASASGKLSYTPPKDLKPGRHSVKVVARDPQGLIGTKTWIFRVVR